MNCSLGPWWPRASRTIDASLSIADAVLLLTMHAPCCSWDTAQPRCCWAIVSTESTPFTPGEPSSSRPAETSFWTPVTFRYSNSLPEYGCTPDEYGGTLISARRSENLLNRSSRPATLVVRRSVGSPIMRQRINCAALSGVLRACVRPPPYILMVSSILSCWSPPSFARAESTLVCTRRRNGARSNRSERLIVADFVIRSNAFFTTSGASSGSGG
mmetsp:Transcript_33409/g.106641  ORF Transcript_33409/g.106641 Transcript_33409/m.106641 type:complete len:215 (-) Transcript_33409:502-1146(-)